MDEASAEPIMHALMVGFFAVLTLGHVRDGLWVRNRVGEPRVDRDRWWWFWALLCAGISYAHAVRAWQTSGGVEWAGVGFAVGAVVAVTLAALYSIMGYLRGPSQALQEVRRQVFEIIRRKEGADE